MGFDAPPPMPVKEDSSISDSHSGRALHERKNTVNLIPQAVRDQLCKLVNNYSEFSDCAGTTAAFIIQTLNGCEVVALGTGNYNTNAITSPTGRILYDSHAVVTARRSLLRFLYRHLLMFFSKNKSLNEKSVFQQNSSSNLLSLKNDVSLHLYVNLLLKGIAQIPHMLLRRLRSLSISVYQAANEISLHISVEGKVFSMSAHSHPPSKLVSMPTTDKIMQWQVLGYQGALLSHFIETVYVQSILKGDSDCSEIRGMEICVCERVEGLTFELPLFYCMVRPEISLVTSVASISSGSNQLTIGVNWSEGDSSVEVVDGPEGKTTEDSPFKSGPALASRLYKAAMRHRFRLVAKEAERQDLLAPNTYREAKKMAKNYQEARSVLRAYLLQKGFGPWLDKVSVSDHFPR
ncbi:LOW QUALITY PROTEIN: adenosine deaminase domain-containing protein 1 [Pholidichthys leucotaenia]